MPIEILALTLGAFATNAYIVADSDSKRAILIDPVDDAPAILGAAEQRGWTIELMLATHAHIDHVLASADIKRRLRIPFVIHADCLPMLSQIPAQARMFGLPDAPAPAQPDRLLKSDSEEITLDSIHLRSLYTPGHAPGHLSFYLPAERILFSGDSLFAGSIGRVDLPGGDYQLLVRSIVTQLMSLDDDVRLLPGHMGASTIGRERLTNPFLLSYDGDSS